MAMVATGPMPGSTPIIVPNNTPMVAYSKLMGVKATPKPSDKFAIRSMVSSLAGDKSRPGLKLQLQQHDEANVTRDRQYRGQDQNFFQFEFFPRQAGNKGQDVN